MTATILLKAVFETGTIKLIRGDRNNHVFNCPHTVVELCVKDKPVHSWLFEHTHPMNEIEAYHRFGTECLRLSQDDEDRRRALDISDAPTAGASLFCNVNS